MREYKEIKQISYEIRKIICNMCGKSRTYRSSCHPPIEEIKISWGFSSKLDGEIHTFDLCDECYLGLLKTFKHLPKVMR